MTNKDIYKAMNNIDAELIIKSAPDNIQKFSMNKRNILMKWGAIAASLLLMICIALPLFIPEINKKPPIGVNPPIGEDPPIVDPPIVDPPIDGTGTGTDTVITSGANDYLIPDPNMTVSKHFSSCSDLSNYLTPLKKTFYFPNIDSIKLPYDFYNSFSFNYEKSNESNMYIEISAAIFDESIGTDNDEPTYDVLASSYRVLIRATPFDYSEGDFEYKLYKYNDGVTMFNNVLYVYYEGDVVCSIYYHRKSDLTLDYWIKLFEENEMLIH